MYKVAYYLKKSFYVSNKQIPKVIQDWVNSQVGGRVIKYEVEQAKKFETAIPWHESDRAYYALFELLEDGNAKKTSMEFTRSGLESGHEKVVHGGGVIPSGYVMVEAHKYPKSAIIYTADDVQQFISQKDDSLSDVELLILYFAKSLKSVARPIFKDDTLYQSLIQKGYLTQNKGITVDGRNIVEDKTAYIRSLTSGDSAKYYNTHTELFAKLPDHSPFYSLASSGWDVNTKLFIYNSSDRSWRSK